tara:strand:+ start:1329 stop:1451 length:123 start_codon:yes stop_codon:yes gene_type:complete
MVIDLVARVTTSGAGGGDSSSSAVAVLQVGQEEKAGIIIS